MIELSKLTAEGLRIEGKEKHAQLEGNEALSDLKWQIFLQRSGGDYFIDIKAEAIFEGTCCRCLEPTDVPTKICAQFLGSPDPSLVARGTHTLGAQDLDVVYLPEELLDEVSLVKEQFILQRPMQVLCKEDCQGLCSQCGKNWNKGLCQCGPEQNVASGTLARAFSELKMDFGT